MRKAASLAVAVALVILGGYVLTAVRGADAQAFPSPCELVSPAEVSRLAGETLQEGLITGTGRGCRYRSGSDHGLEVLVNVDSIDSGYPLEQARTNALRSGADVERRHQGFVASSADGRTHSAEREQGQLRLRVLVEKGGEKGRFAEELLELLGSRA